MAQGTQGKWDWKRNRLARITGKLASTPSAPTNLYVMASESKVRVDYTAPASTGNKLITKYQIDYSSDSGASWTMATDSVTTAFGRYTGYWVTGLTNGTNYLFRVRAFNGTYWSAYVTSTVAIAPVNFLTYTMSGGTESTNISEPDANGHRSLTYAWEFKASGTFTVNAYNGSNPLRYVVYGGGGAGGMGSGGGGGGGGGVAYGTVTNSTHIASTWTATVGAGGTKALANNWNNWTSGSDTTLNCSNGITTITGTGGGKGGNGSYANGSGGACGGGGSNSTGGSGSAGNPQQGGTVALTGNGGTGTWISAGGGGGVRSVGSNGENNYWATTVYGGNGGASTNWSDFQGTFDLSGGWVGGVYYVGGGGGGGVQNKGGYGNWAQGGYGGTSAGMGGGINSIGGYNQPGNGYNGGGGGGTGGNNSGYANFDGSTGGDGGVYLSMAV